ncbi:hypothetical protein SPRG_13094 [Saprolegnia parasitica CBS 223.65]|uniref:Uncharacterized protein n=1 Tax=Saprolegnia parasitica (strain CBS 223.65) TaxID=695850 RepID=A0A067BYI3_SAPPC|nr:hypothetical protein SPRG_13094 [Saprolegnia parasitica CBS 223.65]KDO21910.1 hypothetical protein SPRG_13094 [Saprolegnia parasitica CBS 223.65]|eukprot:XP_012207354.1 hypothetical protein SPRG_13094 [Saprolegnia parasitica CBS 223.65]
MSDDDGDDAYHLRTFARDVAVPQCCLYKPTVERNPTAKLGSIVVPSWPLSTETLAALSTRFAGRVPAKDVVFRGFHTIPRHAFLFESSILGQLDPEQDEDDDKLEFSMTLAHFAIDLTGDASTLTPTTQPPPHTFATVVYFFPSTCVGGAVTIAHGHRTTTFEALDGCFLSFYSTCDVAVAPITSEHRSFAVYYAAYILDDYDSDYSYGPTPKFAPPPLPSIQELQAAARGYDRYNAIAVTIRLETRSLMPTFDTLMGHDKAVVDQLLAADVFDIALVRAGDNDENNGIPALPETFHPLCKTPALVQEVYHQTPIHEVAADLDKYESSSCFLLVWPVANRVRILGYDRTITLLRADLDGDVVDDLGYGSLRGIFEAAFRCFYPQPRNNNYGINPPQGTYAMASLLYDHGDVGLIEMFLDVHDHWADDENMAHWLLAVLRRFGASIFQHRLQTVKVSNAFVAQLVHLATAGDRLAQTIACDCIPLWWPRLLNKLTAGYCSEKKKGLCYVFDIESYLLEHPIHAAASTHLRQHLPDVLVRKVAAYLTPPLTSLLETVRTDKCLVHNLPAVLWPRRNALCSVRLTTCIDVAVEYMRSGTERARCYNGHVLYLALLTAGTPAFAVVDADAQTRRRCFDFKGECVALDTSTLTPMQALVLEEYLRRPTYGCA